MRDALRNSRAALGLTCLMAASGLAASNARWDFLRMNLQVFPGTEQLFEPDENRFWRLRSNLRGVAAAERLPDAEYPFRVSTSEHGFRRVRDVRDAGAKVLFLGDSCTFGIPVDDRESFPAQVQRMLSGVQAVNAGVPGYSAFQGRLLLEEFVDQLRPNVVVIAFWPNGETIWDHLSDGEHRELLDAERRDEFSRHRLTRLLRRVSPGNRERLSPEEFRHEIEAIIERSRAAGAVPVIAVWPTSRQMAEQGAHLPRQQMLKQIAEREHLPLADLVAVFRANRNQDLFVDSIHANRRGYRLAAEALAAPIEDAIGRQEQP